VLGKRTLLTFGVIAASTTLVLNVPGSRPMAPRIGQMVRLAAQAAEIPVPRPLPVDGVALAAAPVAAVPDVAIAPPPDQFVGAAPVRVAPPARIQSPAPARALQSGTWAVVIGINDYPGTDNDLHYAVNDATDTVQALAQQGVTGEHVLALYDGQVTPGVVRSAADWLTSHAGPDAVAVFFYAGHVRKKNGGEAIVTSDGGSVMDNELASWLRPLAAKKTWITMAACYGGGFTELLGPGRVLTGAAPANEVAYESSAFGRSYLGEYMIRRAMVEGAASDTVQTAFAWAHARIAQDYPNREPVQFDSSDGAVNLRPAGGSANSGGGTSGSAPAPTDPQPAQPAPAPDPGPADDAPPQPPPKRCGLVCFH
jgi:hypothetical protein